ncbi:MAG: hypothetical protein ACO1NX_04085 [Chitinophagaceae bacterium]
MKDQQRKEGEATPLHLTDDSTLQTPAEHRHDKSIDPHQDTSREPSKDDLHVTDDDRMAGSDRAGTFERKDNSMNTSNE